MRIYSLAIIMPTVNKTGKHLSEWKVGELPSMHAVTQKYHFKKNLHFDIGMSSDVWRCLVSIARFGRVCWHKSLARDQSREIYPEPFAIAHFEWCLKSDLSKTWFSFGTWNILGVINWYEWKATLLSFIDNAYQCKLIVFSEQLRK